MLMDVPLRNTEPGGWYSSQLTSQSSLKSSSTGYVCADAKTFIERLSEIPQSSGAVLCLTASAADENKRHRTFAPTWKLHTGDGQTSVKFEGP